MNFTSFESTSEKEKIEEQVGCNGQLKYFWQLPQIPKQSMNA